MKAINRREALATLSAAGSALLVPGLTAVPGEISSRRTSMGIVTYAFGIHQKNQWGGRHQGLPPALAMLEECHRLGTGGIMVDLSAKDAVHATELRRRAEQYQMFVEASITVPKTADDVNRFEEDVRVAQTAGADLARTAIMPGRRYEQFRTLAEFRESQDRALQSLQLAAPVLARHKFRLAVENHKDQRVPEKLETLKKVGSEYIGICVDTGNSFTLMEDPLETVRSFAPYALTTHIKDQAVRENDDGFWFADVAMGEGFLDLRAMVKILREANPKIRFNLETITRDALNVPALTKEYWATMPDVPARDLARTLKVIKTRSYPKPFPMVSKLPVDQQLAMELGNIERSIVYAREQLGLS